MFMILLNIKMMLYLKKKLEKKFRELINLGFVDIYRHINKYKQEYTFWDYTVWILAKK